MKEINRLLRKLSSFCFLIEQKNLLYTKEGAFMKHVKMFVLQNCPYCQEALRYIQELKLENFLYQNIEIEVIDEQKEEEKTIGYDYWYVPTFFVNNQKVHEGICTKEMIQAVFEEAIS